ncbi:MAG: hypothetical protein ACP5GO_04475 [Thermoprotei archaeon]
MAILLLVFMASGFSPLSGAGAQTSSGVASTSSGSSAGETATIAIQAQLVTPNSFSGNINGSFSGSFQGKLTAKVNGTISQVSDSYSINFSYVGTFTTGSKQYSARGKGVAQASGGYITSGTLSGTLSYIYSGLVFGKYSGNLISGSYSSQTTYSSSSPGGISTISVKANFSGNFAPFYLASFEESGLPSGTSWSVTVEESGSSTSSTSSAAFLSSPSITLSSTSSVILFSLPNGQYGFSVGPVQLYEASPTSGTFSVNGANVTDEITFTRVETYAVTFTETGLPLGTSWSVTMDGLTQTSDSDSLTLTVPAGTYSYSVSTSSGYVPSTSSGTLSVTGSMSELISFALSAYAVTFTESGLPSGTRWFVVLNGVNKSSMSPQLTFEEADGTYPFYVGKVNGYSESPQSGYVKVSSQAVSQDIVFTPSVYTVSFVQDDLLPGSLWEVTVNGTTVSSYERNATFYLRSGTYSYYVQAPPDRLALPSSGDLFVDHNMEVQVDFPLASSSSVNPSSYAREYFKSNPERFASKAGQSYFTSFPAAYYGYNETPFFGSDPYQRTNVPSIPPYVYSPTLYVYSSLFNAQSLLPSVPTGVALTYVKGYANNGSIIIAISTTGVSSAEAGDWMTAQIHAPFNKTSTINDYSDELTYKVTVTTAVIEDASAGFLTNVGLTSMQAEYQVPNYGIVMHPMHLMTSAAIANPFSDPADTEQIIKDIQMGISLAKLIPAFEGDVQQLYDVINTNLTRGILYGEEVTGANRNLPQNLKEDMTWGLLNPYVQIYSDSFCDTLVMAPGGSTFVSGGIKIVSGNAGIGTTDIYAVTFVQINVYPGLVLAQPPPKGPYIEGVVIKPDTFYVNQLPDLTAKFGNLFLSGNNYDPSTNTWSSVINGGFTEQVQYPSIGYSLGYGTPLQISEPFGVTGNLNVHFDNSSSVGVSTQLGNIGDGLQYYMAPGTYNVSLNFGSTFGTVKAGPQGSLAPWPGTDTPPNLSTSVKVSVLPLPSNTTLLMRSEVTGPGKGRIWVGRPVKLAGKTDEDYWVDQGSPLYVKPAGWFLFYAALQNSSAPVPAYKSQLIANVSAKSISGWYNPTTSFEADANWTPKQAGNYTITVVYTGWPVPGTKQDLITGSTQVVSNVEVLGLGPTLTLSSSREVLGNYSHDWFENSTLFASFQNDTYVGSKPMPNEEVEFYIESPKGLTQAYDGFALAPAHGVTNSKGIANVTLLVSTPPLNNAKLTLVAVAVPPGSGGSDSQAKGSSFVPSANTNATMTIYYMAPQITGPQLTLKAKPSTFGRFNIDPRDWINSTSIFAQLIDTTNSSGQGISSYYVINESLQFWIVTPNGFSTSYDGFSLSNYGYTSTNYYGIASLNLASSSSDTQNVTLTIFVESVPLYSGGGGGSHHTETTSRSSTYIPVNGTLTIKYYVKSFTYHQHHIPHSQTVEQEERRSYEVTQVVSSLTGNGYGEISYGYHIYMR